MSVLITREKIIALKRALLPTGRAWKMYNDGYLHGLTRARARSEAQAYEDSIAILSSILPDNDQFTSDDATDWERRLGLITNLATPLADRKLAIERKYAQPGTQPAHGHYLYLERQLQAAGFNVWVHENLIPLYEQTGFESVDPGTIYGYGNYVQNRFATFRLAQRKLGGHWNNMIVNSLYQNIDNNFHIGNTFALTFFIGGQTLGTYANVLASREAEFRQLILGVKQAQCVGFLFVNYI